MKQYKVREGYASHIYAGRVWTLAPAQSVRECVNWGPSGRTAAADRKLYISKNVPATKACFRDDEVEEIAPEPAKFTPPPPRSNLQWVGVDLDETLARGVWSPEDPVTDIGEPIERNVAKVRSLAAQGWKIHVHTSRPWHEVEHIKAWLRFHGVPFSGVQCGKPLYAAYIDDRAIFAGDEDWTPKGKDARVSG